jgi:hypothetical protein
MTTDFEDSKEKTVLVTFPRLRQLFFYRLDTSLDLLTLPYFPAPLSQPYSLINTLLISLLFHSPIPVHYRTCVELYP